MLSASTLLRLASFAALCTLSACSSEPSKPEAAGPTEGADGASSRRPSSLQLDAFQVGDRILVVARGQNPTGAYDTRFVPVHGADLELRNVPPTNPAVQMITDFELAGWIPVDGKRQDVSIAVAGELERVAVRRAPRVQ